MPPARAFADFMRVAVAKRPVEQFETQVTLPEWQLEPDEEAYFGEPDEGTTAPNPDSAMDQALDAAGVPQEQPAPQPQQAPPPAQPQARQPRTELDGQFLDGIVGRGGERPATQRQGSRPNQ